LTTSGEAAMIEPVVQDKRYRLTGLGKAVADYLSWMEIEDGAAARTIDQYERDLSRLCLAHPRSEVAGLTADEYRQVIAAFPPRSRRRVTAVFRDFSRWLYQEGRAEHDVMGRVRYPKTRRQAVIDIFSEAECIRLLQQPDRDRPLVRLRLEAGPRKGEARRLQLRNVDVEQSRLLIVEGKGGKDRVIPVAPDLVEQLLGLAIREGLQPDDHLWYATKVNQFGSAHAHIHRERPIGEATFARWWRTCRERAGVAYRNPHVCRHTFATRRLRDGGRMETLAKALGHTSIRTTVDLYAHLATEDVAADLARVMNAREHRLRHQSDAQTRMVEPKEAPTGLEPVYEALQASA
jgi:site-specific recombinase XerD